MTDDRFDIRDLESVNRRDLKPCAICGKGVLHTGNPTFYRVRLESCVAAVNDIKTQAGLEMMLGNTAVAAALSPTTTVAKVIPTQSAFLCSACAMSPETPVLALLGAGE